MSQLFKIHHIKNQIVEKTYIFSENDDLDISVTNNLSNWEHVKQNIYSDDSLFILKHKICSLFNNQSIDEIYLFTPKKQLITFNNAYNNITQKDTYILTQNNIQNYLNNIVNDSSSLKNPNSLDNNIKNFPSLEIWNKENIIHSPIGVHVNYLYPFNANPYLTSNQDPYILMQINNSIITFNRKLIFEYTENNEQQIYDIYICFADEVLESFKNNTSVSQDYLIQLYFPNIASIHNILSHDDLIKSKMLLKDKNKKDYNRYIFKYIKNINSINKHTQKKINYKKGISYINFSISPISPVKMPLEYLFKKIHSIQNVPIIQYKSGKIIENIYRLHCSHTSNSGLKIPSLFINNKQKLGKIKNIISNFSKEKKIAFYIYNDLKSSFKEIYCELYENGFIDIKLDSNVPIKIDELEKQIFKILDDVIISKIKSFINTSFKNIYNATSFTNTNIQINNMSYKFIIDSNQDFNIKNIGCLSSIISVLSKKTKKMILNYKKVSLYSEMNDIDAFINNKNQELIAPDAIKELLMENFNLSEDKASEKINDYFSQNNQIQSTFNSSRIQLLDHPGFKINIYNSFTNKSSITYKKILLIENINNIHYITNNHIENFVNSLINMEQINIPECSKDSYIKSSIKTKDITSEVVDIVPSKKTGLVMFSDDEDSDEESPIISEIKETIKTDSPENINESILETQASPENEFTPSIKNIITTKPESLSKTKDESIQLSELGNSLSPIESKKDELEITKNKSDSEDSFWNSEEELESEGEEELESEQPVSIQQEEELESEGEEELESEQPVSIQQEEEEELESEQPASIQQEEEGEESEQPVSIQPDSGSESDGSFFSGMEDSEIDSDNEEDEEDELTSTLSGGKKKSIDLTDIKLKGPKNWFTNRLKERQPDIFITSQKEDQKFNYKKFTSNCGWQYKKHPVILNNDEKKIIDDADKKSGDKSYDESINYEGYHYICPRYWCFYDEEGKSRSLTFNQINKGECGGWAAVNPRKASNIQPGKRIIELIDNRMRNPAKTKNPYSFKPMFPTFQRTDNHPKNKCVPCCSQVPLTFNGDEKKDEESIEEEELRRDKKAQEENLYFKDMYDARDSNQSNVSTNSSDTEIQKLAKEWNNSKGPSFEIKDNNGVIQLEKTDDNGSKQQKKIDLFLSKNDIKSLKNKILKANATTEEEKNKIYREYLKNNKKDFNKDFKDKAKQCKTNIKPEKTVREHSNKPQLFEFPLKYPERLGYLKPILQRFIQYNSESICYENPPNNTNLKKNTPCLLRLGIKNNPNQSFLQTVARVIDKSMTVSLLKETLLRNLNINKFIMAFNGGLIDLFYDSNVEPDIENIKINNRDINEILNTKIEEKAKKSYNNFKEYIKNDKVFIDYTYLWDFITKRKDEGGLLFENGINMIIFNNPNNDSYEKIEIICPPSPIERIFSNRKKTLMLYSEYDYYEPLVLYSTTEKIQTILFDNSFLKNTLLPNTFSKMIDILLKECKAKPSIPKSYKYKQNYHIKKMIKFLKQNSEFNVVKQVINYNLKSIALIVQYQNKQVYLPIFPSNVLIDLEYTFIDDTSNIFNFKDTIEILNKISKLNIPSNPIKIILQNDIVITGLITETNQHIPVKELNFDEKIHYLVDENNNKLKDHIVNISEDNKSYSSNKDIITKNEEDILRIEYIRNSVLEKKFYTCFRNLFKNNINEISNYNYKNILMKISEDIRNKDSFQKIKEIVSNIMTDNIVLFQNIDNKLLNTYYDKRDEISIKDFCFLLKPNMLVIPNINLTNNKENKSLYINRLTDEILRYNRIRDYIFNSNSNLSLDYIKYNINENEIIVSEEVLLNNYLNNIIIEKKNPFIKHKNTYDFSQPINTQPYDMVFSLKDNVETEVIKTKDKSTIKSKIQNRPNIKVKIRRKKPFELVPIKLVENFSFNSVEKEKDNTWNLFKYLFNHYFDKNITKEQIIDKLVKIYEKLHKDNVLITEPPKKTESDSFVLRAASNNFQKASENFYKKLKERENRLYSLREIFRLTLRNIFVPKWENILILDNENPYEALANNIKSDDWSNFYLTEFEYYLLCKEYKIPAIITGFIKHQSKKLDQIYNLKKMNNCNQYLFTTFNLKNITQDGLIGCEKRGNLYTNIDNKSFVYVISLATYKITNFYAQTKRDTYTLSELDMKRNDSKKTTMGFYGENNSDTSNIQLSLNNSYVKKLINNSLEFNSNKEYIDHIFNNKNESIYMQYEKFNFERKNRRQVRRKRQVRIKVNIKKKKKN